MVFSSQRDLQHDLGSQIRTNDSWEIEVFYDGDCPLCIREIKMLGRIDRKQKIRFTDIAAPAFSPEELGKVMSTLMAEIHGRLPDGRWVVGVEVFRHLYAAVGLSPLVALTRLPVISHSLELGYRVFARNRLRFTGRCSDQTCAVDV